MKDCPICNGCGFTKDGKICPCITGEGLMNPFDFLTKIVKGDK